MMTPQVLPIPDLRCYPWHMLKFRTKRREIEVARAVVQLAAIETSIATLGDEDLLDLADIFAREAASPLKTMAAAEMTKRGLRL